MPNSKGKGNEREVLESFASRVDRNDPGALNNLGVLYFRKGMHEKAVEQFKQALKIDSRFNLALENLQYLFAETGIEDPDVKRWKAEVEKDPENDEVVLRLGVSYHNMGKTDEAVRVLRELVERNPDHYMAHIHLGGALKAQGLYQEALKHYQAAADNVNKSTVFHTDLGEIYYNLGRTEEAVTELRAAIKLDSEYWRSHFLLSFANGDIGNFQEALEESRIASKLNPSFQNTEANLALKEYQEGTMAAGAAGGSELMSLDSTSFTLGIAYRERGYYREALKEFQKSLQDMGEKDRVYAEIGKVHMIQDSYGEALRAFLKALEMNADNSEAYRFCGIIYHVRMELEKSAVCYLQSYRLNSADVSTVNNLGVLLYQIGLCEDAERMFKKGLNLKLYNQELNFNFLICNLLKEEYMMAENLIQRLEAFVGKSAALYEKRAMLHYRMNRITAALFDIESALSVDPRHTDAIYLKGLIHLREENFQEAIKQIVEAAEVCGEYTGLHLLLSTGSLNEGKSVKVDSSTLSEVDDSVVELLEAGIKRRFDTIRDSLVSVVAEAIRELEQEDEKDEDAPAQAPEGKADHRVNEDKNPAAKKEKKGKNKSAAEENENKRPGKEKEGGKSAAAQDDADVIEGLELLEEI